MLEVHAVCAGFDDRTVLHGIDLHVATGEAVALLGPSGSGKTTLACVLSGLLPALSGTVLFEGSPLAAATPRHRLDAGLVHVPQGRHVFPNLSLRDNLLLGATRRARDRRTTTLAAVLDAFPRLARHLEQPAGARPPLEQQMLAIGRGLMALPRLLILDDPAAGLRPDAQIELFNAVDMLQGRGLAILLAGPPALPPLAVVNRAYRLERGRVVQEGPADAVALGWSGAL